MINLLLMILSAVVVNSMKNGSPTRPDEFTYIVSVRASNIHICSGVIIDELHIMTIAHIISTVPVVDLGITGGTNALIRRHALQHIVKEVYRHPGFGIQHFRGLEKTYHNDIALLRIERKIDWIPAFAPVPLDDVEYVWDNPLDCILISWDIPRDCRTAMILTWEFIKVIGNEVNPAWKKFLGHHTKYFNGFFGTVAISEGDLGSPIVCGNFIRGIVIQGEQNTNKVRPPVLMSIAPYSRFIQEIIRDGLFDVEPAKYSYAASIWFGSTHVCGGFILDATHIATAGHCVANNEAPSYIVMVAYPAAPAQWLSIAYITIHPGYKFEYTHQPLPWYIDHDFAILTLTEMISWSGGARPLTLPESDDFHEGKICELLRWKSDRDAITGVDSIKLMSSRVVLMDECSQLLLDPSTQFTVPSFWGRSQYAMPIADPRDVGNPIICEGNAIGFLVQAIPSYGDFSARAAKFLKIRPYIEFSSNMLHQNE